MFVYAYCSQKNMHVTIVYIYMLTLLYVHVSRWTSDVVYSNHGQTIETYRAIIIVVGIICCYCFFSVFVVVIGLVFSYKRCSSNSGLFGCMSL